MNDRLLFYDGLKEKIGRTEEVNQEYLSEGDPIDNHFAFGLYDSWFIYPPLLWLLCSSFYHYRTGRPAYAANLARLNYFYMEEIQPRLAYSFTNVEIGLTECGLFDELTGYFSLLFDPTFFTAPPDWSSMKKPSLSMNHFHFITPDQ